LTSKVVDGIDQAEKTNGDVEVEVEVEQMEVDGARPIGALVPFANPLVEDKSAKKVLKSVKKGKFECSFTSLFELRIHSMFTWSGSIGARSESSLESSFN
jgi:hypothetical protein